MKTYELGQEKGSAFIRCLVCESRSFNGNDIQQGFCSNCGQFHATLELLDDSELAELREQNESYKAAYKRREKDWGQVVREKIGIFMPQSPK